jgi:hypothetical protein
MVPGVNVKHFRMRINGKEVDFFQPGANTLAYRAVCKLRRKNVL